MAGYYSGMLEGMLARSKMGAEQTLQQARIQDMQKQQIEMDQQARERALMTQAFRGSADMREGLQASSDLDQQANQIGGLGRKMLAINPKLGLDMIEKSTAIRNSKSMADYRNMEIATKKNELVLNTAMTVDGQDSLNQAVQDLAKAGYIVPPNARQWGPEAQDWWATRANMAKKAIDSLRAQATVQNSVTRVEDLDRKVEKDKVVAQQKDTAAVRQQNQFEAQEKRAWTGLKDKALNKDTKAAAETEIAKIEQKSNYVKGKTYVDAAGNKATWDGTKWVEQ